MHIKERFVVKAIWLVRNVLLGDPWRTWHDSRKVRKLITSELEKSAHRNHLEFQGRFFLVRHPGGPVYIGHTWRHRATLLRYGLVTLARVISGKQAESVVARKQLHRDFIVTIGSDVADTLVNPATPSVAYGDEGVATSRSLILEQLADEVARDGNALVILRGACVRMADYRALGVNSRGAYDDSVGMDAGGPTIEPPFGYWK